MRYFRFKIDIVWQDRCGKTGSHTHWSMSRKHAAKLTKRLIERAFLVLTVNVTQLFPPIDTKDVPKK